MTGEPREMVYRLDYFNSTSRDLQDYLQLFRDAGWEHVGAMSGWQYFRKAARPGEGDEIFADAESKIQKYRRLIATLVIFLPFFVIFVPNITERFSTPLDVAFLTFWTGWMLLYSFCMLGLLRRIGLLKRR